jgi:pimeloyl-ACP methyl ester carboxylesterase
VGQLGLQDVTVIGNSLGGWITAEIALLKSPRVSGPFRIDPATLPPAAQAIAAGNRAAIGVYAGPAMTDPTLAGRLGTLEVPTLVLWGDSDGIVDIEYGRAYAEAIPMARFQVLSQTGHSPQQETPGQVIHAIWDSADTDFSAFAH